MVEIINPLFCGGKLVILEIDMSSLQNKKYRIVTSVIVHINPGTMNELTSINPSVPLRRKNTAIPIIINEPIILGIPKNWWIKAPLPAKIIEALEIRKRVVIAPVNLPNKFGLIILITSL